MNDIEPKQIAERVVRNALDAMSCDEIWAVQEEKCRALNGKSRGRVHFSLAVRVKWKDTEISWLA